MMKITKKYAAFFLAVLLLTGMLTGCSASGSNTGVWIAVIVMVFIAVFSATSGIVYLVLQRVLPPEKPTARTRRNYSTDTYDGFEAPRPTNVSRRVPTDGNAVPRPNPTSNGVWTCPRDRSRNTGPYCAVCGGNRPAAPRPAARPTGEGVAPQRPVKAQETFAPNQQPVRTRPQTTETSGFARQEPRPQQSTAPVYRSPAPAPQPEEAREYRGAFARPAQSEPSALDADLDFDLDSELLEAIFREAAQGDGEE